MMESIATEPRTTPAGLVLPDSCWDDECSPARSPFAVACAGAFSSFTACLVVDWFGAQCDDINVERKTVTQRCLPHDGPPLRFGVFDEYGMRVCGRPSACMGQTSCSECHGDPTSPRCPRCEGRGWVRFR